MLCCYHITVQRGEILLNQLDRMFDIDSPITLTFDEIYLRLGEIDDLEQDIRATQWMEERNAEDEESYPPNEDSDICTTDDDKTDPSDLEDDADNEKERVFPDRATSSEKSCEIEEPEEGDRCQSVELGDCDREDAPGRNHQHPFADDNHEAEESTARDASEAGADYGASTPEVDSEDDHDSVGITKHERYEREPCTECSILLKLEPYRLALRTRAMELARPSMRPLTILDLPDDLLLQILELFQDVRVNKNKIIWWNQDIPGYIGRNLHPVQAQIYRKTISDIRLVCHVFNDLASPLLCPILFVNLDQESLERAVHLSRCPHVAKGILGIKVGLAFRVKDHETDCESFARHHHNILASELEAWKMNVKHLDSAQSSHTLDAQLLAPPTALGLVEVNFYHMSLAMKPYIFTKKNDKITIDKSLVRELRATFRQAQKENIRKRSLQVQLVRSGSFVSSLAACFARMPRAESVGFCDAAESPVPHRYALLDRYRFLEALCHPLRWDEVKLHLCNPLVPAKILFELPIAIQRAGKMIRNLHVGCFPSGDRFAMMPVQGPISRFSDQRLWADIRTTFQNLQIVTLNQPMDVDEDMSVPPSPPAANTTSHFKEYLKAMFTGSELEQVFVSLNGDGEVPGRFEGDELSVSPLLEGIQWKRLRVFQMTDTSLTENELAQWCEALGPHLEALFLLRIVLIDGWWAPILDILREKVTESREYHKKDPHVHMHDLQGAEMGFADFPIWDEEVADEEEMEVRAYHYVTGWAYLNGENSCRKVLNKNL
ncbi:uncharacterized protein BO66DRAFT_440100 [Aspergillus aculeatinus CBS 121060]|uniref:Uncharacterized protein n=1 Tax=Aspergillus aculeatinus CBS 121060 TaxID=1448322 RepID=A0ACD1H4P7_9EURO|nr:hypothetical protein BO66DRAFT_440100 [Aspergillus aculeatinus CBS 121060]RAH68487.1 hypothetical protein BO66DRAFT_440100 [Aspergillus aculeatinus CBS 121060]